MKGQIVLLRLADQYTLAAIDVQHSEEEADLRAFCLYADGRLGECEIGNVRRGPEVNQWTLPPWPVPDPVVFEVATEAKPQPLADVKHELMSAASMAPMPPMPVMVIIRY